MGKKLIKIDLPKTKKKRTTLIEDSWTYERWHEGTRTEGVRCKESQKLEIDDLML